MKKITTFLLALLLTIPAMATIPAGTYYLKPNSNWTQANARFAVYFWDSSGNYDWADMTKVDDPDNTVYQVEISGEKAGIILCRMNPEATTNNWNNKWNQTGDITDLNDFNCVTINDGQWDCGSNFTTSTYTPPVAEELVIPDGLFSYNEGEIAVFFVNTTSWTEINAHVWSDGGDYTSWPGETMTQVAGTVNGKYNCYEWVYDGSKTGLPNGLIIMNANDTDDRAGGGNLTFTNGGVYDGNGKLLTTITATPVVVPTIVLHYSLETIYVGDVVTLSSTVQNGEGYTVKYLVNDVENGETWTPSAAGEYTIAANLMNGSDVVASDEVTVTVKEHSTVTFTVEVPTGTENVNIAGTFNDWSVSQTPMNQVGISNVFTVTLNDVDTATVQYKYVTNQSWDNVEVTADNGNVDNRSYSENDVVAKWKDIDLEGAELTLYLRGTMNDWGTTNPMTYNEETSTYSCEVELAANAQFKIATEDWGTSYGFSSFTNSSDYPLKAGGEYGDDFIYIGAEATVTITVDLTNNKLTLEGAKFAENIFCEENYYLRPGTAWNNDGAWFAAYFFNKNTDAHTWVKGELFDDNTNGDATPTVVFYLSQYNVPAAAPARAKAEEAPVYTHVIFVRMNSEATEMSFDGKWDQTEDLTYPTESGYKIYEVAEHGEGEGKAIGEWKYYDSVPTGLEAVKADGMVYAGNVVAAEGAIEVYNLSGAVVARGNNRVDLNGLAGGVYVVRCGNDVLKVVR